MRKYIALLLCLALFATVFCGCEVEDKTFTCEELTITVPGNFKEDEEAVEGTDFSFFLEGSGIFLIGLREDMSPYGEFTLMEYAQLFVEVNELNGEAVDKGDYALVQYSAESSGIEFTYLACIYKTGDVFWTVQGYCASSGFAKRESKILEIITSATIQ